MSTRARVAARAALHFVASIAVFGVLPMGSIAHASAAAASSAPEPGGYWNGPTHAPVPRTLTGGTVIHARALRALIERQHPIIIDVSSASRRPDNLPPTSTWLPLPHVGIAQAIWIPGAGLGTPPRAVEDYLRKRLAEVSEGDPSRPVVVYCHARCWLSWNGARRAIEYGYRRVYWFPDGIEGWKAAGYPTTIVQPDPVP